MKKVTISCIVCGKEFETSTFSHTLTCSPKCSAEHAKDWRRRYYKDLAEGKRTPQQAAVKAKKANEVVIPAYVQAEPKAPINIKVGDAIRKRLSMENAMSEVRPIYDGCVIYIHPSGRFYVAEFRLAGGTVRESFFE